MIVKQLGDVHFTKDFGGGTTSNRIILPVADGCRVKVTMFTARGGFKGRVTAYQCDETVYVLRGALTLFIGDQKTPTPLSTGATYHVPAGEEYDIEADVDSVLLCVFSAGADGTLPDDE